MKKITTACLLITAIFLAVPKAHAQLSIGISISANIAPPALPVYVQPECPNDGYMWVPGYWAYDNDSGDYYWVPGVWVAPPNPGLLWTPAYWGYQGGSYGFHPGYWGAHVGFYGGINYGGGYGGDGFGGGRWEGNSFRYNTAVVNVNRTVIHNTYIDRTVIVNNVTVNNHNSFNGPGGVTAKPRPEELAAMKERHIQATSEQVSHEHDAQSDKSQHTSANHGKPAAVAMDKVGGNHFTPAGKKAAPHSNTQANKPAGDEHKMDDANKPKANSESKPARDNAVKPEKMDNNAAKPAAKMQRQPQQNKPAQQHAPKQQRAPKPQHAKTQPKPAEHEKHQ